MRIFIYLVLIITVLFSVEAYSAVLKVDDYGAKGDGVTDDQVAIQKALDALKSSGGELQFTSGKTYIIVDGLKLYFYSDSRNYLITTTGEEKATIKIKDGTPITYGHWGMFLSSSKNVTIENLHLDGNRDMRNPTEQESGTYLIQVFNACDGLRLNNLLLENSVIDNLSIATTDKNDTTKFLSDFEMRNCVLRNGWRNNMSVIRGKNFKIIGCEFTNAHGLGDPEAGIDFEPNGGGEYGYKDILIEGCVFKNNRRFGITLTKHDDIDVEGRVTIRNNYFENNGIYLLSENNVIVNNVFRKVDHEPVVNMNNLKKTGIIVFSPWDKITGNKIYDNYFYDNPLPNNQHLVGISSATGPNNEISSNYSYNNNIEGFISNNSSHEQVIHDNVELNSKEMGYWSMDDETISVNSINDLSDFGQTGTLQNSPIVVAGKINEALDFSPDNKYVEISVKKNLNIEVNFTISAWIKWNGTNSETQQVIVGRNSDWYFGIENSGMIGFYAPDNGDDTYTGGWTSSSESITKDVWTYVAATYNGMETKIYINGAVSASETCYGTLGVSSSKIFIGSLAGNTYSFNGAIDDVKLYNYALSASEIEALSKVDGGNKVGQWDFDDTDDLTKATVGSDFVLVGSVDVATGTGEGDGAVNIGVGSYFIARPNIEPDGSDGINTYTLVMDIRFDQMPGVSDGKSYSSLLQTDEDNGSDGDLFIKGSGTLGSSAVGYSGTLFEADKWYRLVYVRNAANTNSITNDFYLDGKIKYNGDVHTALGGRMAMGDSVLFFADDNGEDEPINVAKVVLYNYALTSQEVKDLGVAGSDIPTAISTAEEIALNIYQLDQNYPNPFNPTTNISFNIPIAGKIMLTVYNALGQRVATLVDQNLVAGSYKYNFNGSDLPSGVYFYKLQINNYVSVKKMILLK